MAKRKITIEENITKLNHFIDIAKEAEKSEDFATKLGALTIYAGMVDFSAIQAAKVLEQVILKSQIKINKRPSFKPKSDEYFYNFQVPSRRIGRVISSHLPFRPLAGTNEEKAQEITSKAKIFLESLNNFLNYRNTLVHHLGNSKFSKEYLYELLNKAISKYKEYVMAHEEFMDIIAPYTLTKEQKEELYK